MKTVLKELAMLPRVIGSGICIDNSDVIASTLPALFSDTMAIDASSNIKRMMQMAKVKGLVPTTISIRYDRYNILAIPVDDKALLLILCGPGSNTSLVSTTASMLAPELRKKLSQWQQEPPPPQQHTSPQEQQYINSKTNKALEQIKTALFETVGPIADMIYEDCYLSWTAGSPAEIGRIFELLSCISKEIDNDEFFTEFKQKISALL